MDPAAVILHRLHFELWGRCRLKQHKKTPNPNPKHLVDILLLDTNYKNYENYIYVFFGELLYYSSSTFILLCYIILLNI